MIFFDTEVKVKRLKSSGGNKRSLVATATGEGSIQPVADESAGLRDGTFGTLYVAYVEFDLPVMSGDTITDPDGVAYIVKEVLPRGEGPFPHKQLTLAKQTT